MRDQTRRDRLGHVDRRARHDRVAVRGLDVAVDAGERRSVGRGLLRELGCTESGAACSPVTGSVMTAGAAGAAGGVRVDVVHRQAVEHGLLQHLLVVALVVPGREVVVALRLEQRPTDVEVAVEVLREQLHQPLGERDGLEVAVAVAGVADEHGGAASGERLRPVTAAVAAVAVGRVEAGVATHREHDLAT